MKKIASLALLTALSVVSISSASASSVEQIQPREVSPNVVAQDKERCMYKENVTRLYSKKSDIKETIDYVEGGCYGTLTKVNVEPHDFLGWIATYEGWLYYAD